MAARIALNFGGLRDRAQAPVAAAVAPFDQCCSRRRHHRYSCKRRLPFGGGSSFDRLQSAKAVLIRSHADRIDVLDHSRVASSVYSNTKQDQVLSSSDDPYLHQQLHFKHVDATPGKRYSDSKGWPEDDRVDADGGDGDGGDANLIARLHLVAAMASDRSQMHAILGRQRDNWNALFQRTLTLTTISAAMLSALNEGRHPSLSLPAALLNLASAGMMHLINQFQPSQLAEEQRTAARLFTQLQTDITTTMKIQRRLREALPAYTKHAVERLHSLDKAYPLPLTPGGLEKFPKIVAPPQLSSPVDHTLPEAPIHHHLSSSSSSSSSINGWTPELVNDLKQTSQLIRTADIPTYLSWAQEILSLNKILAAAAPLLAAAAGALNVLDLLGVGGDDDLRLAWVMASSCLSILAMFSGSIAHDMQLGMIFELYRSSAGYFGEIEASIERAMRTAVEEREEGGVFRERVALMLGRRIDQTSIVSATDETAGVLF